MTAQPAKFLAGEARASPRMSRLPPLIAVATPKLPGPRVSFAISLRLINSVALAVYAHMFTTDDRKAAAAIKAALTLQA